MQRTASKTQSPVFKSTISVGLRVGNLLNPSGKEKGAPGEGADHIRAQLLLPVHACDCVHARVCVCVCLRVCARAATGPLGCSGRGLPRGRERGARPRLGRPGSCANACNAGPLCVCVAPRRRGHHFLLRSGQAHKREGGCRPSPSSFPQMPSAAGLLLQYGPRRLSPRPWPAAGLCSALAAFTLGSPPNRLLRLLICLKSNRTSRRSPPGRQRPGRRECAPRCGGRGRGGAPVCGPLCPPGPGQRSGGTGVPRAGARARWPLADRAPSRRFLPSKQSGSAAAAQWQQGWGAGAAPAHQN